MPDVKVKLLDQGINTLCKHILDGHIPKSLENPLNLDNYDMAGDPGEHNKHVDIMLDYHHGQRIVKCKLFVLIIKWAIMTWFKILLVGSIDSLKELYDFFTVHF